MNMVDASGWIEFFLAGSNGPIFKPIIENEACLNMLFKVPGAKSSLGFPGTVTRPGLLACLNCR